MSAVTGKSLEVEALRCLAGGIDTQKADAFLDLLLELAAASGSVTCTLANERVLRLQVRDTSLQELEIPLAKTKLRMLCARLAMRCGEWGRRKISPYGDTVEIQLPSAEQFLKVCFENSTDAQAITVESMPANGAASPCTASPR